MFQADHWRPSASRESLQARAEMYRQLREFFRQRQVLEVETPLLSRFANPDPQIHSLAVASPLAQEQSWYLHTSPEFAMKRLLASGSGAIYQICKVFRGQELGRQHNPEFSMLEWYRPGFSLDQLMDEVGDLVTLLLPDLQGSEKISYAELFQQHFQVDPHSAERDSLRDIAAGQGLVVEGMQYEPSASWLDLLFSHCLQPLLGRQNACFVYDFPASQCALARLNQAPRPGAARFELIVQGMELANGYYELVDESEMRARFDADLAWRQQRGLPSHRYDQWVLEALKFGLPDCSGVALGLDRLLLLQQKADKLQDVISFSADRC